MTRGVVDRIAHYQVLRRIGRGGMGIVYRAVDERDGRLVALKVIRESETAADESRAAVIEVHERFRREAEILKGLLHVNVVSFYEIGEEDGTPYLAMELLEGTPVVELSGRPYPQLLPVMIQAAHGMEYLASRGILHRDLSPDNIFVVEREGESIVKLLDFGLAKLFERPSNFESLTATGLFLGKVAYGSPEQLGALPAGEEVDWRSDVYSLGVIYYQLLSGRRPFDGRTPMEYIAAHLGQTPPPVAAPPSAPPLPMALVALVTQMLAKRREARPQSYREVVDRLVAVYRATPGGSSWRSPEAVSAPESPETREDGSQPTELVGRVPALPRRKQLSRRPRARPGVLAALTAIAITGAAVAGWLTRTARPGLTGREGPGDARIRRSTAATVPPPASRSSTGPSALGSGRELANVPASSQAAPDSPRRPRSEGTGAGPGTRAALVESQSPRAAPVESPGAPFPAGAAPVTSGLALAGAASAEVQEPGGRLEILAVPWASVLLVTEIRSGRVVPLPEEKTTPLALVVPAGTYRVVLGCSLLPERSVEGEVMVPAGGTALLARPCASTDRLLDSLR